MSEKELRQEFEKYRLQLTLPYNDVYFKIFCAGYKLASIKHDEVDEYAQKMEQEQLKMFE